MMFCSNEEFVAPPECPVFEPTWEEFKETMSYIEKIRPIGEKSGICKIRPPSEWQPPFVIDTENFRFTPRIQKLNELEAQTRVKIIFLNGLTKFLELQGMQLKIPLVDRRYLDLYKLQKVVTEEGGFILVCSERKWVRVANRMSYPSGKGIGSTLRVHYERILYPYDIFLAGVTVDGHKKLDRVKNYDEEDVRTLDLDCDSDDVEITKVELRISPNCESVSETRQIMKMNDACEVSLGFTNVSLDTEQHHSLLQDNTLGSTSSAKDRKKPLSSVDQYFCEVCGSGDAESLLLLCDGCDDAYHTFCLLPPLNEVPIGDWRCPKCVAKECHKPVEAYGFEQAECEYTLETFGKMADKFKVDHFRMPSHMVPTETVEKEFWRLVSCLEEDVVVEYGADIHAAERGSGFPTMKSQAAINEEDRVNKMYIESGWNLNNLPVLPSSLLQYISADISGMKVPWCYVGMCFSSFSWHTEDHWSYSVNYMHWGEPKTWYGVPGNKAELLEECMKKIAPELFEQSPDLLHQLTTILNPNVLMAYGVPITRTDQHAGEFVITFPRSYHGGFNQGFNFAEAVNFCPADWVPYGRASVEHYKELHRHCVFSNDELMCKMASAAETLDVSLAGLVLDDLAPVFEKEQRQRESLLAKGLTKSERESFDLLQDDERQCNFCKTTCFLSSITCSCSPNRMVCLEHVDHLCHCKYQEHCLRFHLMADELDILLLKLKDRSEVLKKWKSRVDSRIILLAYGNDVKPDVTELKSLIEDAISQNLPDSNQLQMLNSVVKEAKKLKEIISLVTETKVRTSQQGPGKSKCIPMLTVEELRGLCSTVKALRCSIKEADDLMNLMRSSEAFEMDCMKLLDTADLPSSSKIKEMLNRSANFPHIKFMQVERLQEMLLQSNWLNEVRVALDNRRLLSVIDMDLLIEKGTCLTHQPSCDLALDELRKLAANCHELEQSVSLHLKLWKDTGHKLDRGLVEEILERAEVMEAYLPGVESLRDILRRADDWNSKAAAYLSISHLPHVNDLETMVSKGQQIPVSLNVFNVLVMKLKAVQFWNHRIDEVFQNKHCCHSVMKQLLKWLVDGTILPHKLEKNDKTCIIKEHFLAAELSCRREVEKLRNQNKQKMVGSSGKPCCSICGREITDHLSYCPLCHNLCHANCLLPEERCVISCASCRSSIRPKLETIEPLLASYHSLGVCLPAGEALSILLSQSLKWRRTVVELLRCQEISNALELMDKSNSGCSSSSGNETDNSVIGQMEEARASPSNVIIPVTTETLEPVYFMSGVLDQGDIFFDKQTGKTYDKHRLCPAITLSKRLQIQLEKLIMEGCLIDVELKEMTDISRLVFACQLSKSNKRKNGDSEKLKHKQMKLETVVKSGETAACSTMSCISPSKSQASDERKLETGSRSPSEASYLLQKNTESDSETNMKRTIHRCERKLKLRTAVPEQSRDEEEEKFSCDVSSSDSDSAKDEICSADKCHRPKAKKVNWVQCDRCQLWFHLLCIGQKMNQISRDTEYVCVQCGQKNVEAPSSLVMDLMGSSEMNDPDTCLTTVSSRRSTL